MRKRWSQQRIEDTLALRQYDGRTPDSLGDNTPGKDVVADWYPRNGRPGLVVIQGLHIPPDGSMAKQIRLNRQMDAMSGGLLSHLGIRPKTPRLTTVFGRPWEEACEYPDPASFIAKRNELNESLPPGHKMPSFELAGDKEFTVEEYVAARARGAFLLATGSLAYHDLIAHAGVEALLSEDSDRTHQERVASDYMWALSVRQTLGGDQGQELYDKIMGDTMDESDIGLTVVGIGSDWAHAPSEFEDGQYAQLMAVDTERARALALADREHIAFLASLTLGLRAA